MNVIFYHYLLSSLFLFFLWCYQEKTRNANIADFGWAFSLFAGLLFLTLTEPIHFSRKIFIGTLALYWSGRLTLYILFDRVWGKPEEGRYIYFRNWMKDKQSFGFFCFFHVQAIFSVLFFLPIYLAFQVDLSVRICDWLGLFFGLFSLAGESLADYQLATFRNEPKNKGKTCQVGLWQFSRHPNYFFEWLFWFSFVFFTFDTPFFYLSFGGPVIVYIFLMKFTGVPYTERQAKSHRKDYEEYQKTTNLFFPGPKRGGT